MFITQVVKALEKHQVHYAIVGGFAVALHGAVRGTVDLDLVIGLTEDEFKKAEVALRSIHLESKLPVSGQQVFQFREEYIKNRNLIAWSFFNPKKPIEVVDILITENSRQIKFKNIPFEGIKLRVASIDDLIRMKSISNRPQDQADISALRKLQEAK